ncbi:hypothetical protein QWJ34_23745 [Saccharibacillus sp. CPCC 101409]|uniref:hypothetical protein n=1 Tax=Saccharibacillus sp. CPCC 101409 TaxID=3058041 RepID=UPI0026732E96|nr:hypothetical protein [Saccharibacillus sp. CPCC 101409]MDO3412801.1 hypothetical protein [Saccharibacillus sp. CPCC 101409]
MDRVKPFDGEKHAAKERAELHNKDGRTGKLAAVRDSGIEIRERGSLYGGGRPQEASVCAWKSVKLRNGGLDQPWHRRLERFRGGDGPRS